MIPWNSIIFYVSLSNTPLIADSAGLVDSAAECRKHPLSSGESCWLQLYTWSQVFRSKDPSTFYLSNFKDNLIFNLINGWEQNLFGNVRFGNIDDVPKRKLDS